MVWRSTSISSRLSSDAKCAGLSAIAEPVAISATYPNWVMMTGVRLLPLIGNDFGLPARIPLWTGISDDRRYFAPNPVTIVLTVFNAINTSIHGEKYLM